MYGMYNSMLIKKWLKLFAKSNRKQLKFLT